MRLLRSESSLVIRIACMCAEDAVGLRRGLFERSFLDEHRAPAASNAIGPAPADGGVSSSPASNGAGSDATRGTGGAGAEPDATATAIGEAGGRSTGATPAASPPPPEIVSLSSPVGKALKKYLDAAYSVAISRQLPLSEESWKESELRSKMTKPGDHGAKQLANFAEAWKNECSASDDTKDWLYDKVAHDNAAQMYDKVLGEAVNAWAENKVLRLDELDTGNPQERHGKDVK